jgi:polyhydroxyalkanoate synthase subunit PhaC
MLEFAMPEVLSLAQKKTADVATPAVCSSPDASSSLLASVPHRDPEGPEQDLEDRLDRFLHAREAPFTSSLSYISLLLAYLDWSLHLANSPGRRVTLAKDAAHKWMQLFTPAQWEAPTAGDHRFSNDGWNQLPFNFYAQAALLGEEWWREATAALPGVAKQHSDIVAFGARQVLDLLSPSNSPLTNPEVIKTSTEQFGWNFVRGGHNLLEDLQRLAEHKSLEDMDGFEVGKNLAVTPGKVVLRTELMELIQYAPTTPSVRPEPILIVPAWIMKYYILDLSTNNSFVRYLVSQGFTVFCVSWRNPGSELRDVSLDDYRRLGVMAALDAVAAICNAKKIHAIGYCLGGTLLSIAAAAMARDGDERLATVTLLAAQTDFTEAGELQLFTDESQLALLDDTMWQQGFLDSTQMAGAFQILRSNELIWSRLIKTYLLGEREKPFDLMAWNADATRMPFRMHSEYLHMMFLHNDLAEGRYKVNGEPIAISEIDAPIFAVTTETDHVAPWRSVYKINLLNQGDITFVLTSGGHNAGIVSEPGHPHRQFRLGHRPPHARFVSPEEWKATATQHEGSWWPHLVEWLVNRSSQPVAPPSLAAPGRGYPAICDAPGTYVREK